jgi:hypothetical protein
MTARDANSLPIEGREEVCVAGAEAQLRRRVGAGNRDRTGDIQLGKLAFYR